MAWVVYLLGGLLVLGSLPLRIYQSGSEPIPGIVDDRVMWEMVLEVLGMLFAPDFYSAGVSGFFVHFLPAAALSWSYLLVLPGFFLLWLAGKNGVCLWIGRILWLSVLLCGPGLIIAFAWAGIEYDTVLGASAWGLWLWLLGMPLLTLAHWVARKLRVPDQPPVEGSEP